MFGKTLSCILVSVFGFQAQAASGTTSSATLVLQGVVHEVASLSTVSVPADLDLRPGSAVVAAKIGQVQIKTNSEIAGVFVSSNTKSGTPENANNQPFKTVKPFTLKVNGDCKSLKTDTGIVLSPEEKNIATSELTQLSQRDPSQGGINENCNLSASWSSDKIAQAKQSVNSDLYSMSITVTLVSQ